MIRPLFQGRAFFLRELVPLINANNAGERAADVVQKPFKPHRRFLDESIELIIIYISEPYSL
jgi:hypothetical protein